MNASNRWITPDVARASPYRRAAQGVRVVHADSRPSCTRARCRPRRRLRRARAPPWSPSRGGVPIISPADPRRALLPPAPPQRRAAAVWWPARAFPSISGRERDDATPATSVPEDTVRAFDRYFGDADAREKNGATDRELPSAPRRADEDDEEYFDGDTEDIEPEENPVPRHRLRRARRVVPLRPRARDRKNPKRRANKDKDASTSRLLNPKELKRRFQEKRAARVAKNESKRAAEAAARARRLEELHAAAKIEAAEAESERALRSAEALERDATRRQMIDEAKVRAKTEAAARAKALEEAQAEMQMMAAMSPEQKAKAEAAAAKAGGAAAQAEAAKAKAEKEQAAAKAKAAAEAEAAKTIKAKKKKEENAKKAAAEAEKVAAEKARRARRSGSRRRR